MSATATDYTKLSLEDLRNKLGDKESPADGTVWAQINNLVETSNRDPEQEAQLIDLLDDAEQIAKTITSKKREDIDRRLGNLKKFDSPAPRKSGGGAPQVDTFDCFGDKLRAVYNFRANGTMDQRLVNALGANEGTPSEGGVLVGTDFEKDLQSKMYGEDSWLGMIRRTPISASSNMLKLRLLKETSRADGSRQGGVRAYWEGEGDSTTASQRQYDELEMSLRKLFAVTYASSELLEDATALEAETTEGYNEEMSFKLGDAVVNGDGVGKPLGILNSPAKVSVAVETGQTSNEPLNYDNICKMWARLHPRSQMSAVWFIDLTLVPSLFTLGLTNGTAGTPVYLPPGGASGSPYGTIFGRPVIHTEFTKAKNTEGDIILWDPTQYRLIEKGGIKGASSMHVAFLTDEWAFRFTYRVNGAPKWRAPLTPKNGGDTLSTIVTLAARS